MRWRTANNRQRHKRALRWNVLRKYGAVEWDRGGNYSPFELTPLPGFPGVSFWMQGESDRFSVKFYGQSLMELVASDG